MKKILETIKNKWAEYILEVLVIIFGIVGAFGLNAWNDKRQLRAEEQKIIEALKDEFQTNLNRVNEITELNKTNIEGLKNYIQFVKLKKTEFSTEDFNKMAQPIIQNRIFYRPSLGVYNDVISSGKMAIISNDELRRRLAVWEATILEYTRNESVTEGYRNEIKKVFIEDGNLIEYFSQNEALDDMDLANFEFENDSRSLIRNEKLTNLVIIKVANSIAQNRHYHYLKKEIEEILEIMDIEMEGWN